MTFAPLPGPAGFLPRLPAHPSRLRTCCWPNRPLTSSTASALTGGLPAASPFFPPPLGIKNPSLLTPPRSPGPLSPPPPPPLLGSLAPPPMGPGRSRCPPDAPRKTCPLCPIYLCATAYLPKANAAKSDDVSLHLSGTVGACYSCCCRCAGGDGGGGRRLGLALRPSVIR